MMPVRCYGRKKTIDQIKSTVIIHIISQNILIDLLDLHIIHKIKTNEERGTDEQNWSDIAWKSSY
jgi:hypothetical protein